MFLDDINEVWVSAEHDEEEINGENFQDAEEEFWIDIILERFDYLRICFASIIMLNLYDTEAINLTVALLFCSNVLHNFTKNADVSQNFLLIICELFIFSNAATYDSEVIWHIENQN